MKQITENVARAWASIDSKSGLFDPAKANPAFDQEDGTYSGYFTGVSPVEAVSLFIALLRAKEAEKGNRNDKAP